MFGASTLQKVSEKLHMQSKTHADQTNSPLCNDFHTISQMPDMLRINYCLSPINVL